MKAMVVARSPVWSWALTAVLSLAGPLQAFSDAQGADQRIVLRVTLPGGRQVKVTQLDGEMASVTTQSLSVGLTPRVKGDLVAVAIHELDTAGKPAAKPLAVVTGELGQSLTLQLASGQEPLRVVPERVY